MKRKIYVNWQRQLFFAAIVTLVFIAAGDTAVAAQGKYKVGDRVECDTVGNGNGWRKGTVIAFQEDDVYNGYAQDSGYFYRVMIFAHDPKGQFCKSENMRLQAKAAAPLAITKNDGGGDENQPQANNKTENQALKFKRGDRVECDNTESGKHWDKGTVIAFEGDEKYNGYSQDSGYFYRVRIDRHAALDPQGRLCKATAMRPLGTANSPKNQAKNQANDGTNGQPRAKERQAQNDITVGNVTEDEDGTVSADRPILDCPVAQTPARNGAAPNAEVIKKAFRCQRGEKPASQGSDGAVTIDVSALQVGSPRPWDRLRDMGGGTPGKTTVYPIKITYTEKTFYRFKTTVIDRTFIMNYFVNSFGEWKYGSGEEVKSSGYRDIPRAL